MSEEIIPDRNTDLLKKNEKHQGKFGIYNFSLTLIFLKGICLKQKRHYIFEFITYIDRKHINNSTKGGEYIKF